MSVLRSVRSAIAKAVRRAVGFITDTLYGAGGHEPVTIVDFEEEFYRGVGVANFTDLITHVRNSNAVMTDGYGPELVTNGGFDSDVSGWLTYGDAATTVVYENGRALVDGATTNDGIFQTITVEPNKTYIFEADIERQTATGILLASNADIPTNVQTTDQKTRISGQFSTTTGTSVSIRITNNSSSTGTFYIDSVSVREMPVLKWAPHNLLPYSEDLSQATWILSGADREIVSGASPVGTDAYKIVGSTANTEHKFYQTLPSTYTHSMTVAVFAKADGYNFLGFRNQTNSVWDTTFFNLSTGQVGTVPSNVTAYMEDVGNGWYLCKAVYPLGLSFNRVQLNSVETDGAYSFTADGTSGTLVWGAHTFRSDLGGMVDNPERGDSYVPTAGRATGPEVVTNGTFNNDISDWTETDTNNHVTPSYNNGKLRLTSTTNTSGAVWMGQTLSNLTTGQTYIVTADITITGTATASVILHNPYITSFPTITSSGRYHFTFNATATSHEMRALVNAGFTSGSTVDFDNISLRKSTVDPSAARYLPRIGHHVYNGSAWVNEGLLAESEARTNLVTYSDIGSWVNLTGASLTPNDAIAPDGTETADKLVEDSATSFHFTDVGVVMGASAHTASVYLKAAERATASIFLTQSGNVGAVFDLSSGTVDSVTGTGNTATIQDVGNGWYRCAVTNDGSADINDSVRIGIQNGALASYAGDGSSGIYVWGVQVEQASTPSSLIPTSGSSVTRAAETFTIPSANLPWPSPNYIGSELVTNGTFDTDTSNWTAFLGTLSVVNSTLRVTADSAYGYAYQSFTTVVGNVYQVKATLVDAGTTAANFIQVGTNASPSSIINQNIGTTTGTYSFEFVATDTTTLVRVASGNGAGLYADWDNISVREINPLSVSIAMDGRITYADTGSASEKLFLRWLEDGTNQFVYRLFADSTNTGGVKFVVAGGGNVDSVQTSGTLFNPGVLVPFNLSARHGSTFVNGAVDGVALTADTTPTALPDLSATDLELAYDYMGTIRNFRVWDKDIGDTGLVEATQPSTEPSLSLTFEGTGTNSFIVNDWSE